MDEINNIIVWDEKFAIGIPVIDGEHKKLVALCNNLYLVLMNGRSFSDEKRKEAVGLALKECVDYTNYHFKHEEELMEFCNFDPVKFAEHKKEHKAFIQKIYSELNNFNSENHVSSYKFVKFLYEWILSHIGHVDRLYIQDLHAYLEKTQPNKK